MVTDNYYESYFRLKNLGSAISETDGEVRVQEKRNRER